jgi:hypothetical protein
LRIVGVGRVDALPGRLVAWRLPGGCLAVAWRLPGGCLGIAWRLPGGCLEVAWKLPGGSCGNKPDPAGTNTILREQTRSCGNQPARPTRSSRPTNSLPWDTFPVAIDFGRGFHPLSGLFSFVSCGMHAAAATCRRRPTAGSTKWPMSWRWLPWRWLPWRWLPWRWLPWRWHPWRWLPPPAPPLRPTLPN